MLVVRLGSELHLHTHDKGTPKSSGPHSSAIPEGISPSLSQGRLFRAVESISVLADSSRARKTIIDNGQWVCLPCNLKKPGKFDISTPFRIQKEVYTLSADVLRLMSDCNNICQSNSKDAVFKITNKVLEKIGDIEKAVKTKDEFGNFADGLYEIIYEGSDSLNRVPKSCALTIVFRWRIGFYRALCP